MKTLRALGTVGVLFGGFVGGVSLLYTLNKPPEGTGRQTGFESQKPKIETIQKDTAKRMPSGMYNEEHVRPKQEEKK